MRARPAILLSLITLGACGGAAVDLDNPGGLLSAVLPSSIPSSSKTVRCNLSSTGVCDQITGTLDAADESTLQASCLASGGSYAQGSCSAGTVAGHCAYAGDPRSYGVSGSWESHYSSPMDSTTAQSDCSGISGTWVP